MAKNEVKLNEANKIMQRIATICETSKSCDNCPFNDMKDFIGCIFDFIGKYEGIYYPSEYNDD